MDFLLWADGSDSNYQLVSLTLIFAVSGLAVWSVADPRVDAALSSRRGTFAYLGLVLLALAGSRWPTFFVRDALNQDEAQMLAQAITALHDPIPWVSFDGTTSGPFNTYVLALPALLGLRPSFFTTRVVGMLLEFGALAALYVATSLRFDRVLARVAVLPPLFLFAFLTQQEMVHYSSERLPLFLGMLAVALVCVALQRTFAPGWLFGAGVAIGMMPLAKLQSAPLAAAIGLVGFAVVLASGTPAPRAKVRSALELGAGIALIPLATLSVVALAGGLQDFWISYIQMALAYILWAYEPWTFLTTTPEAGPPIDVLLATTLAGGVVLVAFWKRLAPAQRNAYLAALAILIAAIYTVYSPKRGTLHYVLFAVFPAACAAAASLGLLSALFAPGEILGRKRAIAAGAFVLAGLLACSAFFRPYYPYLGVVADYYYGAPDPLSALMERYLRPGDRLAIWGWRPKYYVYTDTLLGTRDSITQYHVSRDYNPYLDYFRARYIRDLEKRRPLGFLDAGDESFAFGGSGYGYEMFPELAAVVRRDYQLVGTVSGKRFFVRKDALSAGR